MALRFSGSQQREFLIFHIFWYAQTIQRKYHKHKECSVSVRYDGAVRSFDDILSVKWRGQTFAESEKKARSNLGYQFRKHMGLSQSVPIRLTGKMTVC